VSRFLSSMGRLFMTTALFLTVTAIAVFGWKTLSPVDAKHGGTAGGGTSGSSSLSLVLLNSTDGLPHWGQNVTFNVSTTATNEPYVSLECWQNGTVVYGASAGFFPGYPWPGSQIFPLSSPSWTGGGASCAAKLYYVSGKRTITLNTLNFQVYA
jgi:hypothetical protein